MCYLSEKLRECVKQNKQNIASIWRRSCLRGDSSCPAVQRCKTQRYTMSDEGKSAKNYMFFKLYKCKCVFFVCLTWIVGCMFQPFWPIWTLSDISASKGDAAWQFTLYHLQGWKLQHIQHPISIHSLTKSCIGSFARTHLPAHIACCFAASYQMPWIKKMNIESRWNQPWQDKFKPTGCCDAISWSMSSQVPQEKDGKGCGKSFSEEVSPRNLASRSCNAIALEIEFLQTCF